MTHAPAVCRNRGVRCWGEREGGVPLPSPPLVCPDCGECAACLGCEVCTRVDGQGHPCGRCGCRREHSLGLCAQCGGCVPCCDCVRPKDRTCSTCGEPVAAREVCYLCGVCDGCGCFTVCRVCGLCDLCSGAPMCEDCRRCTDCRPWCHECDRCMCTCECDDAGERSDGDSGGDGDGGGGEGRGV